MVYTVEPLQRRYWKYRVPSNEEFLTMAIAALLVASIFIYSQRPLWAYGVFVVCGGAIFFSTRKEFWPVVIRHKWLLGSYAAALTVALPVAAFNSATAVLHYGMAGITMALAVALSLRPSAYLLASRIVIVSFQLTLYIFVLTVGFDDLPLDKLFHESSSNGVTSSLIALQVNYMAALYFVKGRVATLTTVATLALCILGYGRASVITALLLMALVTVFPLPLRFDLTATARRAALIALTVCATMFSVGLLRVPLDMFTPSWVSSSEAVDGVPLAKRDTSPLVAGGSADQSTGSSEERIAVSSTKLQSGLYDQARDSMIREYVGGMNGFNLMFGRSYEGLSILDRYNGNPHNSYIRAHHIFGLLYGLAIFAITAAAVLSAAPIADKVFLTSLLVILLFRAFTETLIFPTVYDVVYFGICMWLLERGWNRRQTELAVS